MKVEILCFFVERTKQGSYQRKGTDVFYSKFFHSLKEHILGFCSANFYIPCKVSGDNSNFASTLVLISLIDTLSRPGSFCKVSAVSSLIVDRKGSKLDF